MAYQVSARKWRPQKFSELVGQEHIVQTLTNAIELDRVSHAYLFSGTRGVGKTTTARIFAKALNCEKGPATEPCDACVFCDEIREGRSVDVQEIDGASNTGVSEVRDIIDNVNYAASACAYKVYIIDEVHMLSRSAFNALLKTLEEPPPKVVFIFATTEQRKIPETILSRCQSFEFKPLSQKQIVEQLRVICDQEKIQIDSRSLGEVAKIGAGSMRDAQSLLDQVIAYCGAEVSHGAVESVLGVVGHSALETFVQHLIDKDAGALLALVANAAENGKDLNFFCRDLIEYFRDLLFAAVAKNPETILDGQIRDVEKLKQQAGQFHVDQLHQMFRVLSVAEMEMKRSSLPQAVFEMAAIRLTDARPFRQIDELIRKVGEMQPGPAQATQAIPSDDSKKKPETPRPASVAAEAPVAETARSQESPWEQIRMQVCEKKPPFQHYLSHCRVRAFEGDSLHLEFDDSFTLDLVKDEDKQSIIRETAEAVCGRPIKLKLSLRPNGSAEAKTQETGKTSAAEKAPTASGIEPSASGAPSKKQMSKTESEIIQNALDIFGGVVIR